MCAAIGIFSALGCAPARVGSFDAYEKIPMNRVVPYPDQSEIEKRTHDIALIDRDAIGLSDAILAEPRAQVRRALAAIALDSRAAVVDRSLQTAPDRVSDPDYALATQFSTYRYASEWKPPFKFLWQSQEDVAQKQGTCTHRAEVEFEIQVIARGKNDRVVRTYALEHAVEQANKDVDSACTIAPVARAVMFENAVEDAMSCLTFPLGELLSPRGYVTGHRKERDGQGHIYRISLGAEHGIKPGEKLAVRREQRSTSPAGEEVRLESIIAGGVVTDQIKAQRSWIAIDPAKATTEILDGDLVRPVLSEGLLSSLSGPKCDRIVRER